MEISLFSVYPYYSSISTVTQTSCMSSIVSTKGETLRRRVFPGRVRRIYREREKGKDSQQLYVGFPDSLSITRRIRRRAS